MLRLQDPTLLRQQAYIDGAWVNADGGATREVRDPATGERSARFLTWSGRDPPRHRGGAAAFPAWAARTAKERAVILRRWYRADDGESGRSGARS